MKDYKIEIIEANIAAREKEIAEYEVGLFNYEFIRDHAVDPDFKHHASDAIMSTVREMNKSKLVLRALQTQLDALIAGD